MEYLYELIDLLNRYTERNIEIENKIRDLVCYLSEKPECISNKLYRSVIFEASEKLRTFGYIKGQNKILINEFNENEMFYVKHKAIQKYYQSKVYKNNLLDKRQKDIIDEFETLESKCILLSAPTSFGKTFLLREIIFMNKEKYINILMVFPTIALLNENSDNMYELISNFNLEYKVINNVYTNFDESSKHIFVLTPERTLKLLSDHMNLKIDFFFFDEVYKIDEDYNKNDGSQSIIKSNRAKAFRIALYLLSKTVKDYYLAGPYLDLNYLQNGMAEFLKKNHITKLEINFEPTIRIEYDAWKLNCIEKHPVLGESKKIIFENRTKSINEKIVGITKYIKKNNLGQTIFYCSTPSKSMNYTRDIYNLFDVNTDKTPWNFIEHLKRKYNIKLNNINSSSYWSLIKALEHGIGIHHGKFPKYIQNEILRLFNNGTFNYLFCTSTIIEGVNTNARNIVILNNSVGRSELTSFALKNIKGRAGRYYHNNIGRIFYTDKKQRQIEATNNMNLNFQTYDDIEILNCDIDNADLCDLGFKNKIIKRTREEKFDKLKLPDDVFIKNRLIERDIQEKYLEFLLQYENFEQFSSLISDSGNIHSFISNSMINKILDSFVKVGILDEANYNRYCAILVTYCKKGTTGLLDYQVKKLLKNGEKFSDVNMDSAYIITFEQIRNIIEYEVPKILCLFEALYKQAGKLMQKNMDDFNMSSIIRYYELGIMTELGLFLVEYGFPVDTIRNIEHKYPIISNLSALEASNYINEHAELLNVILDPYEIDLYNRAMVILEKRNK